MIIGASNDHSDSVSAEQVRGATDTLDATAHSDARMISQVYDRRRSRKATPAR